MDVDGAGRGGDGSGGNLSDREQWGAADEALFAHPPLTYCCAAWFVTGAGLWPMGWGPLV